MTTFQIHEDSYLKTKISLMMALDWAEEGGVFHAINNNLCTDNSETQVTYYCVRRNTLLS